jgi:hypothetical protein
MDVRTIKPRNTDPPEVAHNRLAQHLWNPTRRQSHAQVIRDFGPESQHVRGAWARLLRAISSLPRSALALAAATPDQLGFGELRSVVARFLAIALNTRA